MKTFVNLFNSLNESETEAYKIKKKVFTENTYLNENCLKEGITVEEVTRLHNAIEDATDTDEIQDIIYGISDGVLEDEVQLAFDQSIQDEDDLDTLKGFVISTLEDNAEYLDEAAPIDDTKKEDRLASLKTQLDKDGDQLADDEKEAINQEIVDLEKEELNEEEKLVWTTEVDTSEEAYNAAWEGYDDDEKPSYEEWLNSDFDAETDYIIQDLDEFVLPSIEKQLNDDLLFIVGDYNSNYSDFRPSGAGSVTLKGTKGLRDYIARFDDAKITSEDGNLNIRCADHDGSVKGTLCTIINDRNKILEELGYVKEYGDEAESEYENDLYYDNLDYRDFYEHPDLIIPIKNTITEAKENNKLECKTLTEKVDWNYFDKFNDIIDKYMPSQGEGENLASQIVTAVNKLIYKWYNDGDVYDNVNSSLQGWANNLSSYANWLAKYAPGADSVLNKIFDAKNDNDYEELLKELADTLLNENLLSSLENKKEGSIYNCDGPFEFKEYSEDEEDQEFYESEEEVRKDSIEKGLLTETGEWDESDEDLLAWKDALRTAAEEIAKNIGGEVKIVKGFDAYQGPFAIIATPKYGDIELWSGPEEDLLDAKLAHVGWIEGSTSEISELLNMDTIPEERLISESLEEIDTRTYDDEDEAAYYRNKELYSTSHLARHREAMEKAKKACEDKNIKLDEEDNLNTNDIVDNIINNFKEITGVELKDIFNYNKEVEEIFNQAKIEETSSAIIKYLEDLGMSDRDIDDLLYDLDNTLSNKWNEFTPIEESDKLEEVKTESINSNEIDKYIDMFYDGVLAFPNGEEKLLDMLYNAIKDNSYNGKNDLRKIYNDIIYWYNSHIDAEKHYDELSVDPNNLTKEQLWQLRKEIVLGSLYIDDYKNSFGINPQGVYNFFESFIEDAQQDDDGNPNNRKIEEFDNAEDLYNYYTSCENPFGADEDLEESEDNKICEAEVKGLKQVKSQGNIYMLEDETKKVIVGENYNQKEGLIENAEIYNNREDANKDYFDRCGLIGGSLENQE